jgi:hypothetical protein
LTVLVIKKHGGKKNSTPWAKMMTSPLAQLLGNMKRGLVEGVDVKGELGLRDEIMRPPEEEMPDLIDADGNLSGPV